VIEREAGTQRAPIEFLAIVDVRRGKVSARGLESAPSAASMTSTTDASTSRNRVARDDVSVLVTAAARAMSSRRK
jgi:hypothetical protein